MKYLNTFVAVAKHASFSKAGDNIGLSHTGVSMHIRRLEDDLGCKLFDRSGKKKILLTQKGHEILPLATQIAGLYRNLRMTAGAEKRGGRIQLGVISSVQNYLFPMAIRRFYDAFPAAEVISVPGASVHLLAKVDAGEIDMAIIDKPSFNFPKTLKWVPILREPYVVAAPLDAPEKTAKEVLKNHGLIAYPSYSNSGKLVEQFLIKQNLSVVKKMEQDDPFVILRLVEEGIGAAITPLFLTCAVANFAQKAKIYYLGKSTFYREVGILQRREAAKHQLAMTLADAFLLEAGDIAKNCSKEKI